MARSSRSPKFLAIQRRQLDARLTDTALISAPHDGWVKTIRLALGMTAAQLGKRLGMSQQGAIDLERREKDGSITLAKLGKAAAALNCELKVGFVPRPSLEETVRIQAEAK